MGLLNNLKFDPSTYVLYQPNGSKQQADLKMINDGNQPIMVKMKSTRPGLYKMRPVFGLVPANGVLPVRLIFKGLKPNQKCPTTDRYTIVASPAISSTTKVEKMWTQHKYHEKLAAGGELRRKKIHILYVGVNDHMPPPPSEDDGVPSRAGKIKRGKGLIDDPESLRAQETQVPQTPILLMYRPTPAPLSDDEDDDDDSEKATIVKAVSGCSAATDTRQNLLIGEQDQINSTIGTTDATTMKQISGMDNTVQYPLSQGNTTMRTAAPPSTMTTLAAPGFTNGQYPLKPNSTLTGVDSAATATAHGNTADQKGPSSTMTVVQAAGFTNQQYLLKEGRKSAVNQTAQGSAMNNVQPPGSTQQTHSKQETGSQINAIRGAAPDSTASQINAIRGAAPDSAASQINATQGAAPQSTSIVGAAGVPGYARKARSRASKGKSRSGSTVNAAGPVGASEAAGATTAGSSGPAGPAGPTSSAGTVGGAGANGGNGPSVVGTPSDARAASSAGATGKTGVAGPDGSAGAPSTAGAPSDAGVAGTRGSAGPDGASGGKDSNMVGPTGAGGSAHTKPMTATSKRSVYDEVPAGPGGSTHGGVAGGGPNQLMQGNPASGAPANPSAHTAPVGSAQGGGSASQATANNGSKMPGPGAGSGSHHDAPGGAAASNVGGAPKSAAAANGAAGEKAVSGHGGSDGVSDAHPAAGRTHRDTNPDTNKPDTGRPGSVFADGKAAKGQGSVFAGAHGGGGASGAHGSAGTGGAAAAGGAHRDTNPNATHPDTARPGSVFADGKAAKGQGSVFAGAHGGGGGSGAHGSAGTGSATSAGGAHRDTNPNATHPDNGRPGSVFADGRAAKGQGSVFAGAHGGAGASGASGSAGGGVAVMRSTSPNKIDPTTGKPAPAFVSNSVQKGGVNSQYF